MTDGLAKALDALRESSGLDMVAAVGADGLLIESFQEPDIDADALGAIASSGLLMMDTLGRELGQGQAQEAILQYDQQLVILTPLSEDLLLVVMARGDSNLGRIRLLLRRSLADLRAAATA